MILNLEGEKSTGMYATGNYDLAKTLGKKLNEYGNSTLFIFVDISGSRSVSDETIAEILSNADLIQIHDRRADAVSSERKEIVFCIGYLFCLQQMVRKRIKNAYLQGLQTKRPRQNSTEKEDRQAVCGAAENGRPVGCKESDR